MVSAVEDLNATGSSIKSVCALMKIECHVFHRWKKALNRPVTGSMFVSGKTSMDCEISFSRKKTAAGEIHLTHEVTVAVQDMLMLGENAM